MWTYNLANHLMVDLETIITLAPMTYTVETNLYELHPMDERVCSRNFNSDSGYVLLEIS